MPSVAYHRAADKIPISICEIRASARAHIHVYYTVLITAHRGHITVYRAHAYERRSEEKKRGRKERNSAVKSAR